MGERGRGVLAAEGLVKSYRRRRVVDGVAFAVREGEVVGLLGPNGAGKTTSFNMVVGMVRPDAGRILLDDADLTGMPMHRRARRGIGYLPQESSIFRKLTVRENFLAVLELERNLEEGTPEQIATSARARQVYLGESFTFERH